MVRQPEGSMERIPVEDVRAFARTYRGAWPAPSFLAQLDAAELDTVATAGTVVRFARSETLIREGDDGSDVYLLLTSTAKVSARTDGGGRALLAVRVAGDAVGELAALDGAARTATVEVCGRDPLVALRLEGGAFLRTMEALPAVSLTLTASVARKLRTATRRRVDYTGSSSRVKLARVLVEMAEDYGRLSHGNSVVIGVDLTQVEWGALIGASESTAYRTMRALRELGLVDPGARRLVVRDLPGLRDVAYPASCTPPYPVS
ncbi:Crp/Fnr family transcriptional regulator [Streptomyces xantholiticus]|uniref:Crp/Fnr family transcriptional regulator n=1 Tax=Streptomyces xantholiticus TaxID=68285 RepID=A0ABV1UX76_9ACTN